ncbi:MAG TPA: hypothetical protein VID75_06110 [Acidimicrobiales bacterium]
MVVLGAALLGACGGPAVANSSPALQQPIPPTASYGHGSFAFSITFLAKPTHSFMGPAVSDSIVVARAMYFTRFNTSGGVGAERVVMGELSHVPTGKCILRSLEPVAGGCPKPHGDILLRGVWPCRKRVCDGFSGAMIILRDKMAYEVDVLGVGKITANDILNSFSPHG